MARMPTAVALATVLGAGIIGAVDPPSTRTAPAAPISADAVVRAYVVDPAATPGTPPAASPSRVAVGSLPIVVAPPSGAAPTARVAPSRPAPTVSAATLSPPAARRPPVGRPSGHAVPMPRTSQAGRASTSPTHSAAPTVAPTGSSGALHGWITTADATRRVDPLTGADLTAGTGGSETVTVNPTNRYQTLAGTGAALTESSAHLLMQLPAAARQAALANLFDPATGAGISLLRLPLGASDFALSPYTYDDDPPGGTDPQLTHETVAHDDAEIVPIARAALAIDPALTVVATPWSAPAWMKTTHSLDGGSLISGEEQLYAQYLVLAIAELRSRGIPITAITVDDEPENTQTGSSPTMSMSETQEATVVQDTRALLSARGMDAVEILGYDHNWSDPSYPDELLASPATAAALGGTAWHCYGGDPSAQLAVEQLHPSKEIWETECSGGDFSPGFAKNLSYDAQTLGISGTRDGSRSVLLWNLALDPSDGPHDGGCSDCRGVVTIDPASGAVTDNVEWDVLALLGRATRPGATRIDVTQPSGIGTEAWQNTDGSRSLFLDNTDATGSATISVTVTDGTTTGTVKLPAGAAVTLAWGQPKSSPGV